MDVRLLDCVCLIFMPTLGSSGNESSDRTVGLPSSQTILAVLSGLMNSSDIWENALEVGETDRTSKMWSRP